MKGDLFELKNVSPMLLTESDPFDSDEHLYELKLDGIRAVAYLEPGHTELRNKRNKILNVTYPELKGLHQQTSKRCIIDGELVAMTDGKPNFFEVQKRSLMTDQFKIELSAKNKPVQFVAYDILYLDDKQITDIPLIKRKKLLEETIRENNSLTITRYIQNQGINFYNAVAKQDLEGIVAKRKTSLYYMGKRSKDWVKFKKMMESDLIICGYVPGDEGGIKSLVLGAYHEGELIDQGHVALGISKEDAMIIQKFAVVYPEKALFEQYSPDTLWFKPELVCKVEYMMRTQSGYLRQPVYKGIRLDKEAKDCVIYNKW